MAASIAARINTVIPLVMYFPAEKIGSTNLASEHEGITNTATATVTDAVSTGAGAIARAEGVGGAIINSNVKNVAQGAAQYTAGSATGNISQSLQGAFRTYFGQQGLKANNFLGYKGIAGFVANIAIGTFADKYENRLADETKKEFDDFNKSDRNNGISVVALKT